MRRHRVRVARNMRSQLGEAGRSLAVSRWKRRRVGPRNAIFRHARRGIVPAAMNPHRRTMTRKLLSFAMLLGAATLLIGCQPPPTQPVPQSDHHSKDNDARAVALLSDANHSGGTTKAPREDYSAESY